MTRITSSEWNLQFCLKLENFVDFKSPTNPHSESFWRFALCKWEKKDCSKSMKTAFSLQKYINFLNRILPLFRWKIHAYLRMQKFTECVFSSRERERKSLIRAKILGGEMFFSVLALSSKCGEEEKRENLLSSYHKNIPKKALWQMRREIRNLWIFVIRRERREVVELNWLDIERDENLMLF